MVVVKGASALRNEGSPILGQSVRALRADGAEYSSQYELVVGPVLRRISKISGRLMSHGAACTSVELVKFVEDNLIANNDWKGENPDFIAVANASIADMSRDLNSASDLALSELIAVARDYKEKAIRVKCSLASKEWRTFCIAQLSRNVGARVHHRFVNRQNAPNPVPLFKIG